jgi:hypothetical protein
MHKHGIMPRKSPNIQILKQVRENPTSWVSSSSTPKKTVIRAKMILESEAGKSVNNLPKNYRPIQIKLSADEKNL